MSKPDILFCDYCEKLYLDKDGKKTSDLKRGKIKNSYCSEPCWKRHKKSLIENDICKRCRIKRKDLSPYWATEEFTGVTFCNGYCQKCYGLLLAYNYADNLCKLHETTQTLKKEISNDKRKKYRRPSQIIA